MHQMATDLPVQTMYKCGRKRYVIGCLCRFQANRCVPQLRAVATLYSVPRLDVTRLRCRLSLSSENIPGIRPYDAASLLL